MNTTDLDQLDQILSSDDVLTPSSGFAASVMDAVRDAAAEPPPLPFPWRRFAAGLLTCCISSAAAVVLVERIDWSSLHQPAAQLGAVAPELAYATVVLGVTLAVMRAQRILARG